ncbi:hypothetical protein HYY75_12885 [bacterium]|nr:hypothetical protein [bacterium]
MGDVRKFPYLFLDSSETCIRGQISQGASFFSRSWETHHRLDAMIISICNEMLKVFDLDLLEVNRFGVCIGPGSFTGLRTSIAFLRALAQVLEKPLRGIDLFSWASQTLSDAGVSGQVQLVLPTYRGQFFIAEMNLPISDYLEVPKPVLVPSFDFPKIQQVYGIRFETSKIPGIFPSPEALDFLMEKPIKDGFQEILKVAPLYVLPTQAEINLSKVETK